MAHRSWTRFPAAVCAGVKPAGRPGAAASPHGLPRRLLRRLIHFLAYRFVLDRRYLQRTNAAGFRLAVRPTVFHPRYFISSECFAAFISGLELGGKRVADVGTGSGILALAAARAGAAHVVAADINPNAALTAAENARANGFGDRVGTLCCDLFSAVAPTPRFDVVLASPPKHAGEPRDLADRGWHAGPRYRDIAALFAQARTRLAPGGRFYLMVSSDSDLELFAGLIERAGFRRRIAYRRSILIESFIVYELSLRDGQPAANDTTEASYSADPMPLSAKMPCRSIQSRVSACASRV